MFFPSIITRSCLQAVSFFTNNKSEDSSTVKPASRELILQLLSTGCLKFGQFTLKSGESSSYYIDLRQSTMHVELNKQIAKQIKFVIQNENKRPSDVVVVGVPYGVVPAASAAAILMDAPYLLVRKEVKAYGNETVSSLFKDREHILIEDVMTTGSSIIETINKLDGRKITDVIVIVDREGGGKENIKKAFPDLKLLAKMEVKEAIVDELKMDIEKMEQLESDLIKKLQTLVEEQREADKESRELQLEKRKINQMNETYWTEYNQLKYQLFNLDDEILSAENKLAYYKQRIEKLSKMNVLNATFHIWHTGNFATINGFRLGRLPKEQVSWDEINAAWGQCVLLLHCLAKKVNLKFERFKLVPYGNNSFIESLDNKSRELPLYVSGGFMFIWTAKFDQAMVAYLDCLQQFKEKVEKDESNFRLPYKMEQGKIIDSRNGSSFSIKMQTNSEEHWTKAMKFMLTNLKWSLAYVVSNHTHG